MPSNSALHVLSACGRWHNCRIVPGNAILLIGTQSFAPAAQSAHAAAAAALASLSSVSVSTSPTREAPLRLGPSMAVTKLM